jgi:hypothetical protein
VIVPDGHEAMTNDELHEAYLAMGFSPNVARAYVMVLRQPPPGYPVD